MIERANTLKRLQKASNAGETPYIISNGVKVCSEACQDKIFRDTKLRRDRKELEKVLCPSSPEEKKQAEEERQRILNNDFGTVVQNTTLSMLLRKTWPLPTTQTSQSSGDEEDHMDVDMGEAEGPTAIEGHGEGPVSQRDGGMESEDLADEPNLSETMSEILVPRKRAKPQPRRDTGGSSETFRNSSSPRAWAPKRAKRDSFNRPKVFGNTEDQGARGARSGLCLPPLSTHEESRRLAHGPHIHRSPSRVSESLQHLGERDDS